MNKTERIVKEIAESEGLVVSQITYGRHMKVYVQAQDGRTGLVVGSRSGSDFRQLRNTRSDFRKFAQGRNLGGNDRHIKGGG